MIDKFILKPRSLGASQIMFDNFIKNLEVVKHDNRLLSTKEAEELFIRLGLLSK